MNFKYHTVTLDGFDHPYNQTAKNERAVELAVAERWLTTVKGAGLEVGNVLAHYNLAADRRIVDRYETAADVENVDVFDIRGKFDWIVSISTIEHVGWDTAPRDPDAAEHALEHLRSLLKPKGKMLVTVPAGYHPTFDDYLATGAGATRSCTLVRSGDGWRQTKTPTFKPYAASTPWAESVWIGEWS